MQNGLLALVALFHQGPLKCFPSNIFATHYHLERGHLYRETSNELVQGISKLDLESSYDYAKKQIYKQQIKVAPETLAETPKTRNQWRTGILMSIVKGAYKIMREKLQGEKLWSR